MKVLIYDARSVTIGQRNGFPKRTVVSQLITIPENIEHAKWQKARKSLFILKEYTKSCRNCFIILFLDKTIIDLHLHFLIFFYVLPCLFIS